MVFDLSWTMNATNVVPVIVSDAGTFKLFVSIDDGDWTEAFEDDEFILPAPARVRLKTQEFAGWINNDPRQIYCEIDMGERYDFEYTDHPALPTQIRKLAGTTAGFYPTLMCGHAMRGTDMSGNQVLTATHDQGGGNYVGTLDQTVSVFVSDGAASLTRNFTIKLVHPDVYYADRTKVKFTDGSEPERIGSVYVTTDGDFTGAPAAQAATASDGGIFHLTYAGGEFNQYDLRVDLGISFGSAAAACVYFKAGQTFYPLDEMNLGDVGTNGQIRTWFHGGTGGTEKAIISYDRLANFNPREDKSLINTTGGIYRGTRLKDVVFKVSDFDVSDPLWREWPNTIKYTGKVGTIDENTTLNNKDFDYDGEILSNGNGVYVQVLTDDGAGTLVCRQVVDTADVDDLTAAQAFFVDGDTLTGQTNGATMTFVAAGSEQDRTKKCPGAGIRCSSEKGILLDGCEIHGASSGIAGLGFGAVLSDSLIKNCWNYGAQQTGGDRCQWSENGMVTVQPAGYEGTIRSFNGTVNDNRNFFNVMFDATTPALNNVSHSVRRSALITDYSATYCFSNAFGGHGGAHAPHYRMGTNGVDAEDQLFVVFYGIGAMGGNNQLHFSIGNGLAMPFTPKAIIAERCHLIGSHSSYGTNISSAYSNYVIRNCVMDHVAGSGWDQEDIQWLLTSEETYPTADGAPTADYDANAVDPIIEFCTLTALRDTTPASTVSDGGSTFRGINIIYRNNAYVLDTAVLGTVDAGIAALADEPAEFDALLRPLATATQAYQTGTADGIDKDALDATRPATGFSKGAFEPA